MMNARTMRRRGFTIAEGAIGVLLVAGLLVSAISTAGVQARARRHAADRIRAEGLAHDLMAEVLQMHYSDPGDAVELFGRGVGEALGSRPTYDDVDDYDGHSESPPAEAGGAAIAGYTGWGRRVDVARVDENGNVSGTETGLKRVTVTVSKGGVPLATLVAVRSAAWEGGASDTDGSGNETRRRKDGSGGLLRTLLKGLGV
ncbi:MAG: hypothetical protein IT439_12820 [Phycisphaerales bacterium]|nr:hypothetical protein [Phycisphaerales bacterium]